MIALRKRQRLRALPFFVGNHELARYFEASARLLEIYFLNCYNYWYRGFLSLLLTRSEFYRSRNFLEVAEALVRLEMRRCALPADELAATMLRSYLLLSFPPIIC